VAGNSLGTSLLNCPVDHWFYNRTCSCSNCSQSYCSCGTCVCPVGRAGYDCMYAVDCQSNLYPFGSTPSVVFDLCGVCGGNNTCLGCDKIPGAVDVNICDLISITCL
jgi:hypothetical protein